MAPVSSETFALSLELEKVSLILDEEGKGHVEVNLSKGHLKLINRGVTTAPVDSDLVHIALAHAAKKVRQESQGDHFIRKVYHVDKRHTDLLIGPNDRLDEAASRALLIETTRRWVNCSCGGTPFHRADTPYQPPCWSDGSFQERVEPCQILAVYDPSSVCFVTEEGNSILVARDHLTTSIP